MVDDSPNNQTTSPLDYATPKPRSIAHYFGRFGWVLFLPAALALLVLASQVLRPSLSRGNESANRAKCASSLRGIGRALALYADTHGGRYPRSLELLILEPGAVLSDVDLICPSSFDCKANGQTPSELAQNIAARGRPDEYATATSRPEMHMSYVYCVPSLTTEVSSNTVVAFEPIGNHDFDGIHVLCGDGSVRFVKQPQALKLIAELQAGHNPPRDWMLK